ncbi:MAG: alpha/beta hydrolase [Paludisphaera borealis]|uniref:alpha/beta hydrolase n=1 Tax=Paludisphaera borealis TaxID=1387353 RepID=UPI00284773CE|nr:alpha/beta hydrolase [Paludisphaera borealis]MDR3620442.1 alpha/beta hydrolase [Paludisphaera borealis]
MPRMKANGLTFHVQQAGDGPDVVLIHGLTGDMSIWFLAKTLATLAESFRVTAYDLRGHGYTDAPAAGYTSLEHAHDLLALLDELEIPRARLVGHSFGAVIATHAAVLAPDRVEAIVLSDPYFPSLRHLEDVSRWGHWQNFRKEAEEAGVSLSADTWYDLTSFFDQVLHLDDQKLLAFRQAVGLPGLNRVLRLARTTCGHDSKLAGGLSAESIAQVSVPCLALYGENSPFLSTADYLVQHLPQCQGRRIPDAQHRAPEENPEAFNAAVRAYLESLQPAERQEVCS